MLGKKCRYTVQTQPLGGKAGPESYLLQAVHAS